MIPSTFCFLTDPEGALAIIDEAKELTYRTDLYQITADFRSCQCLGLGALIVLYTILSDGLNRLYRTLGLGYELLAMPSTTDEVNRILNAPSVGFASQPASIIRSPTLRGRSVQSGESTDRDRAGTEIVDYFNRCLHTEGLALTADGRKYIANLVTEALGNAEDHSGPWVAQGYFLQQEHGSPGECHLVLFNFGDTIFERMSGKDASPQVRDDANALATRHLKKGFFKRMLRKWDLEALVTLYALQEGVSSRLHEKPSRGNGTIEVIKAFSELAGEDQRMCILSGSAYILFDGSYDLVQRKTSESETRRFIAFNEKNDLEEPPSEKYVYSLDERFPGTILALRFKLDRAKLKTIADEEE